MTTVERLSDRSARSGPWGYPLTRSGNAISIGRHRYGGSWGASTELLYETHYIGMGNKPNLSPWNGVVSGTAAAVLANVLVYPLDVYGIRLSLI